MFNKFDRNSANPRAGATDLLAVLLVTLAVACGESRPQDPYVSTDDPRETLTELDFGDLDSTEIRLTTPWSRNRFSKDPAPDLGPARLVGVAGEELAGYDRVIFSFEDRIPGYRLAFVTGEGGGCDGTEAADGAPARIAVEFEPAVSSDGDGPLVEDRDRAFDFPALAGAAQSCDEGGVVRWLLAANAETDYRLLEMAGEPRLVVDLSHPVGDDRPVQSNGTGSARPPGS